jgi:ubiquinone/menaquinone biosynthesis C-methylase UbiE
MLQFVSTDRPCLRLTIESVPRWTHARRIMGLRERLKPHIQDFAMRSLDDLRPATVGLAVGDVLEVGFGTARNLVHYGAKVERLTGIDPMSTEGMRAVETRIAEARFPIERVLLTSPDKLPFDAGRFDTIVTTWTLCSILEPDKALLEVRRVLKPGGRYLFVEHGRSPNPRSARWQDRLNPIWRRVMDGCNLNRRRWIASNTSGRRWSGTCTAGSQCRVERAGVIAVAPVDRAASIEAAVRGRQRERQQR